MAVVGQSVPVLDAGERVTGQVRYVLDAERPGMLTGRILRSPHAHARIIRVDASRAAALPGVYAVLTRADLDEQAPSNARYGRVYHGQGIVAIDRVRFVGDPLAAVAAVDGRTAEQALDLIEVEYEPLDAVFDIETALQPDAPLLYEPRLAPQPGFAALVGEALFEELVYDDGQLVTQDLADYMIPSFGDVPRRVESAILERAGAGEVHGIGETSLPPVAPAVANAVYNATGVRITDLPLTPAKIVRGLQALRGARPAGQ